MAADLCGECRMLDTLPDNSIPETEQYFWSIWKRRPLVERLESTCVFSRKVAATFIDPFSPVPVDQVACDVELYSAPRTTSITMIFSRRDEEDDSGLNRLLDMKFL